MRSYLAAYGPATRADIEQFTGSGSGRSIQPSTACASATVSSTCRVARRLPATCRRRCDSCPRTSANATTKNVFTVDGFVAGAWRVERKRLVVEPFAPLPAKWRREVDAEGERLRAW